VVRNRAVTLHYCDTLMEWGIDAMRHRPSPESFQQARLLFDTVARILGKRPRTVLLPEPATPVSVTDFVPTLPPLNPRLLELYDHVAEHLRLVRDCIDAWRLRNGRPNLDMSYFGDNPLRDGWRSNIDVCVEESEWCLRHSPYRFQFLIQKALELATGLREFSAAYLSATEKGDAEYMASLRAEHERELFALGIAVRQDQWRDADWQIQALQQTKDLNQADLIYYTGLYQSDLINDEIQYQTLATTAMQTRTSANMVEAEGEAMKVIPDLFLGFPCTDSQIPIGTKLAGVFETIGKVISIFAEIQSATASLDLTLAGWQRRSDEWLHQTQKLPIQIQQIEMLILGAQRLRDQNLLELNNQQRQGENSAEILNFLRDKFTSDKLYMWMQKETFGLLRKMHHLAVHAAHQAEHAFNFERGHTTRRFIPDDTWDTLHDGLLAGERLEFALRRMEKAYCDENVREYELTKHISLRLQFPGAFLRLRTTGYCEIDIPEWMFDLDYPGHYMRRIKNVTLTLPCVTGPYTGVHCTLTLLSSSTRIDPSLHPPAHHCCRDRKDRSGYEACPDDPRIVRQYAARESIATSSGQNDSGLFELNFRDDRYLPFEYLGAVSRWRIEFLHENNFLNPDSLTETMLKVSYTSRPGSLAFREAAREAARGHLPGDGWCFFDIRRDFPDAWQLFQRAHSSGAVHRQLDLHLRRNLFPYLPGMPEIFISEIVFVFDADCACHQDCLSIEFQVVADDNGGLRSARAREDVRCVPAAQWPDLRHGSVRTRFSLQEPFDDHRHISLRFPDCVREIRSLFLFCRYETIQPERWDLCCGLHSGDRNERSSFSQPNRERR
jgi:Tc toxin complex TcA C-terminal TcB-binding domain